MKQFITILLAIALSFTFAACGIAASEPEFTIKFGHIEVPESCMNLGAEMFKKLVEERSNGRIAVDIFPNGQLGNEQDLIEGVKMGSLHITPTSAGAVATFYEPINIFMMPYYLPGANETEKYKNLMAAIDTVYPQLSKGMLEEVGLHLLPPFWYGDRTMTNSKKPIESPADIADLRIRVPDSPVYTETIKALGGSATPLPLGEVYMALSQGIIDGQDTPPNTVYVAKYYEVQKYIALIGQMTQIQTPVMNEALFQSLPDDLKKIVETSFAEAAEWQSFEQARLNTEIVTELEKQGMIVTRPNLQPFIDATKNVPNIVLSAESLETFNTLKKAIEDNINK